MIYGYSRAFNVNFARDKGAQEAHRIPWNLANVLLVGSPDAALTFCWVHSSKGAFIFLNELFYHGIKIRNLRA